MRIRTRFDIDRKHIFAPFGFGLENDGVKFDLVQIHESEPITKLRRLAIFQRDLGATLQLLDFAGTDPVPNESTDGISRTVQDGLYDSALVLFMRCFEPTQGLRTQPLNAKRIFTPLDRAKFKKLGVIRNKIVAHDEQLFGTVNVLIARRPDLTAGAIATWISGVSFFAMEESKYLKDLAQVAFDWIDKEASHLKARIIREYEALSPEARAALQPFTQYFTEIPFPP